MDRASVPAALMLTSQLATLEPPADALALDAAQAVDALVAQIVASRASGSRGCP